MSGSRRSLWFVLALALCGFMCLVAAPEVKAQKGGTLVEAMGTEPTNLDIFKMARKAEYQVVHLMIEPLFVINTKMESEPLLAENYKVSDDQLTWSVKIKKGIKFHDGEPLNAAAVKYSFDRHKKSAAGQLLSIVTAIDVQGEDTVVLKLEKPYPLLLTNLSSFSLGVVSPKAAESKEWGSKVIAGTGPLRLKQWISGDRVVLERNPEYRHAPSFCTNKGPAYVDEYVLRFVPEPATLIAELTEGNVDLSLYVSERDVAAVKGHAKTTLITIDSTAAIYLAINCDSKNSPYNDPKVRQALAHSINKRAVLKAAYHDVGTILYTPLSTGVIGYSKEAADMGKEFNEYDLDQAKRLLEEAGWKDTDKDGIREKDGEKLDLVFMSFTMPRYKRAAEVVQPMLQEAGFKVKLEILEAGDLYARIRAGSFDLISIALVGSQGTAVDDMVLGYHSKNIGNILQWSYYNNPDVDKLIDAARFDIDPEKRKKALNDAQKELVKTTPVAPMVNAMEIFAFKKATVGGVENYSRHPWAFNQLDCYRGLELFKK